jgi:hypothetical protein
MMNGVHLDGVHASVRCVSNTLQSGVSGVHTSVTGAYRCTHKIDVHEATHECFSFSLFESYLKFLISISPP